MTKHVAVLMGGWSAEREVSFRSGKACADALARLGYRVTPIDVGRDIATVLGAAKPDAALNVLHGRPGEDGTLQGVMEILGIPYSHSGVLASALAMQKDFAKAIFRGAGVPVAEDKVASRFDAAKAHLLPPPYVIKPIAEGSSVGVFIVSGAPAPAAGALPRRLGVRRQGPDRALHPGQGTHLRRHRRPRARRHRDRAGHRVLRLRSQIRRRRLPAPATGANFTKCLPGGPQTQSGCP